jgi:hypothetical protein
MIRTRGRRHAGHAMIELVFSLVLLVPLFVGTWQFGYAFFVYAELEQAVRAGARYASLQPYHSSSQTVPGDYKAAVQNVVVYGTDSPAQGATPVVSGLRTNQVGVTVTFSTNNTPAAVSVYVNGSLPGFFAAPALNNKPLAWFPYVGMFGPP